MIRRRRGDTNTALLFEDEPWTWDEHAGASATRAALACALAATRTVPHRVPPRERPRAQLLARRRRGGRSDDGRHQPHAAGRRARRRHPPHRLPARRHRAQAPAAARRSRPRRSRAIASSSSTPTSTARSCDQHRDDVVPRRRRARRRDRAPGVHVGNVGRAEGGDRLAAPARPVRAQRCSEAQELTAESVCYLAMPMFHSNALYAGWSPAVYAGATIALRRRFSASGFLDDVRRYGVTYFNYVGKPLSYILATPPRPDDREHTLVRVLGNEGTERDIARFSERFGVPVTDSYGSTEGGVTVRRSPSQPTGALGRAPRRRARRRSGDAARRARPRGSTTPGGSSIADECIGEIVNTGPRLVRGLLQERRGGARADAQRLVLVGRPRLRRRRRVAVVRRARLRLAARRRRELRRRAGRAHRRRASPASCSARSTRCRRPTSATR